MEDYTTTTDPVGGKTCPKCGVFKIITEYALNKTTKDGYHYQCRECNNLYTKEWRLSNGYQTRTNSASAGYVYLLRLLHYYKIGIAVDVNRRVNTLNSGLPFDVEIVHTLYVDNMAKAEAFLHRSFEKKLVRGEWFLLQPEDVDFIKSL